MSDLDRDLPEVMKDPGFREAAEAAALRLVNDLCPVCGYPPPAGRMVHETCVAEMRTLPEADAAARLRLDERERNG